MIWKNGPTWEEYKKQNLKWHKWFAWHPVVVGITQDQHKIKAWLQYIERSRESCFSWDGTYWECKYRLTNNRGK